MMQFTTKLAPFWRGFCSCKWESRAARLGAGFLNAARELPLSSFTINERGLCLNVDFKEMTWRYGSAFGKELFNYAYIDSLIEQHPEDASELLYIKDVMKQYGDGDYVLPPELAAHKREGHLWGGGWMGHSNPDFAGLATHGSKYYRAQIEDYREKNPGNDEFYDGLMYTLEALEVICHRYSEKAEEMLRECTDEAMRVKLEKIVKTFDHAPEEPCRDFAEACIVFMISYLFDGNDSPGHFDQYMYTFWKITDEALRQEYLDAVWDFLAHNRAWNLCISGSDENGNDLTNSLSYAILEEATKAKSVAPNLTLRWHKGTPKKLMEAAYRCIATGCGIPALYNDEVVVPALEALGIPKSDAHEYVMNGCNQIDIQSKSHMGLEDGEVCIAKAVELALHNGISGRTGVELGPRTGEPESFKTFEDFYSAYLIQMQHLANIATNMSNFVQKSRAEKHPNPYRSIFIEGCIEKARDYKNGGPLYGHGQILLEGIAEAADSLAAIKKYVYEEKKYTLREIADITMKNFEGYEEDFLFLKNSELRFGNNIEYVDKIAADIVNHMNRYLRTLKTFRGGYYSGGCSPFERAPRYGMSLGALPCGRKSADPLLADSIGATPGRDVKGPTALLSSCLAFDHTLPASGFILNLKFDKKIFCTEAGMEAFLALWETYFKNGGQQLQIGVVSAEDLINAQKEPEKYGNLIVRVGGYSDHFVRLSKELQDNVIARTMY